MIVLGIETSCDETGVGIYDSERGLVAHRLFSQVALHEPFGGVVPELASRDHIRKLLPLVEAALADAGLRGTSLTAVAYTAGPGLIGALLVGATLGVGLAMTWGVPAIPVHHMEAHLLAPMMENNAPEFPLIALLVSGGHTMLVDVRGVGDYRVLGETLDDAAGEAFDKTAKLLGLPYPGGPELAKLAEHGDTAKYRFPRPMMQRPGLDFSFSGLKTAVMLKVRELEANGSLGDSAGADAIRADLASSFQAAVVDTLVGKSLRALDQTGYQRLIVAGGVGANRSLRRQLESKLESRGGCVYYPGNEYCTDNGAMIAYAGLQSLKTGFPADQFPGDYTVHARARWELGQPLSA